MATSEVEADPVPVDDAPEPEPLIVEAARRVLAKHGYDGLTLERIAAAAGVSRMTLHRRGFSKDDIFDALSKRARERYRDVLWPALTAEGSGAARLEMALYALCEECEANLDLMLAIRAQADALYHQVENPEATRTRAGHDAIARIVSDGVADGSLEQADPPETSALLSNWCGWTYVHLRTAYRWTPERTREVLVRRLMKGLTT